MEKQLLIKYHSNYADEFDVDGFAVWPESKWEEHKTAVTAWFDNRAKKRGPKPELPAAYTDPKYYEAYDKFRKWERDGEVECYFGTNEAVNYSSLEDYLRCFKTTEITEEELQVLTKFFGEPWRKNIEFSMFLTMEGILEDSEEEDEEDGEG